MKDCSMFLWKERSKSKAASYWRAKIAAIGSDFKSAWKTVNLLLGETKTKCHSSFSACDYHEFVDKKINDMRKVRDSAECTILYSPLHIKSQSIEDSRCGACDKNNQRVANKALQPRPNSNTVSEGLRLIISVVRHTCCQPFSRRRLISI